MSWPVPAAVLPEVEGVTLGRTVSLDRRAWTRHGDETFFGLDRAELVITGQGYIKLDELTHIHRFYTDDEVMLQAGSASAAGGAADDLTLFHGLWSNVPASPAERDWFLARICRSVFEHEGVPYDRFWYAGYESDQEPVILSEAVYEDRSGHPVRHVQQTCMLYSRPLSAGGAELLLALEVTPEGGQLIHEIMVGIALAHDEFNA